ncbi:oligoendopeptidase F [Candidatus Sumerlaeota bacterium]|nr:oligoendopeptidase F [Candidatus Sumerlaeota bacterium]
MTTVAARSEIARESQWDVDSIYPSPQQWEADFERIAEHLGPITEMRGRLSTPEALARVFEAEDTLGVLLNKLYLYAHMMEDVDTTVGDNQARMGKVRAQIARINGETAFIRPEVLKQPEETLKAWRDHPALKDFRRTMDLLFREKPHTLGTEEETLLGLSSDVFSIPYEAFSKLTNADMKFKPVRDGDGNERAVSNSSFLPLLQSGDRNLRKAAFASIYEGYGDHVNVLSSTLSGSTRTHALKAKVRKFGGALESSLFNDNIPTTVYHSLIQAVHNALPIFHRYLDVRARQLGLDGELNMWDLHVPIVQDFELSVSWDECREWVMESTKPLGEEYQRGVLASFRERWYDIFENKGKRSGAYSTGAFGQKPFMLLNYHSSLDDVFTVAHELGHSMHTLMSHRHQPYRYSDYPIFLAEIASTTNEALLQHYLMQTQRDPQLRAYLLNHLCDSFRGTMYRQAMFAQFELAIHERVESGESLTADWMNEYYYGMNAKLYGPKVKADERIALEWSRIPHFYYNFYVYKYATGFAAAQIFSQRILEGAEKRDAYLGFLKSGCSRDPLDTVKDAGVDLSDPKVLEKAFARFDAAIGELEDLLTNE